MVDETDMVEFGLLPFDVYVATKWDPNSSLTKTQQFRSLVESWVRLGKKGRNEYPEDDYPLPEEIPPYVPRDLLTDEERARDGQSAAVLWIRTWYGRKNDPASQSAADDGYKRLRSILSSNDIDSCLEEHSFFEKEDEFGQDGTDSEFIDGIARGTPGSVPSYMLTALMRKPDTLDGLSQRDWPEEFYEMDDNLDMMQCMMVVVADRKACEEGWVLFLAVNQSGEVLPFRVRESADYATQLISNYLDGQCLDENTRNPEDDVEHYMREGDGWA
ncbi:hypothetical protein N7456_007380 [Penicillium angulare]|uniref:Uncharacterized protein n=1 Tax=Penicillium angulare TaxID=116970 RepID=A0A9W9K848_9EURO|nr:hypothetical protein N7456_007380 [Penicillium angulare]